MTHFQFLWRPRRGRPITAGETAQIERAERRYAWLRRRLNAKAEIWAIFPESWRLTQRMCLLFAQVTRTHLAEILDNKVRSPAASVVSARVSGSSLLLLCSSNFTP